MRRLVLVAATIAAVLAVAAATAAAEPGVTARNVTIGGTFPLSGPAALYATIPIAMKAYFSHVNARRGPDGRRGVYGRQIIWKYMDDQYSPPQAVQLTRGLVEQDKVFAVVASLGTEVNLAVRPYLNALQVPQILVSTGASTWGADWKTYPWTGGWQPSYRFEGTIYGRAIARNSPNARIAVLYQNDDYGKDLMSGLESGLGAKTANIAGREPFDVTAPGVASQIAKLKATGASVFVIIATPGKTVQAYTAAAALRWSPTVIYTNAVSATDTFLTLARAGGAGDLVERTFTTQYAKDPASPRWDDDPGMRLYRQVMARYYPKGRLGDALNVYGVAVAHAFVQLLYRAGPSPTRASLMRAMRAWDEPNPFLIPGIRQRTTARSQFPIGCMQLVKFTGGTFRPVSRLECGS